LVRASETTTRTFVQGKLTMQLLDTWGDGWAGGHTRMEITKCECTGGVEWYIELFLSVHFSANCGSVH
jgi:hypothetical protein